MGLELTYSHPSYRMFSVMPIAPYLVDLESLSFHPDLKCCFLLFLNSHCSCFYYLAFDYSYIDHYFHYLNLLFYLLIYARRIFLLVTVHFRRTCKILISLLDSCYQQMLAYSCLCNLDSSNNLPIYCDCYFVLIYFLISF